MIRQPRGMGTLVAAWVLGLTSAASAQSAGTAPAGTAMPPAAMLANPYLNPMMNPYMNPSATLQPMNTGNALFYLYAANSANGGLGSGRISGSRGSVVGSRPRAAEMPNSASLPGAGAARYFNPGSNLGQGASRYYSQRGRYFNNNGR